MTQLVSLPARIASAAGLAFALAVLPAQAEKGDRAQPLTVAADRQGTVDLQNQVVVFAGNVVITKGTIRIQADRVEVREGPDGYRTAVAIGSASRPATFRQKRDGVDEYITGQADRLEYEERGDVVRFIDNAIVRRLRGATVADEITGSQVTYDNTSEVFSVTGGTPANTAGSPGGRVRAVLAPREGTPAAAEAASQPRLRLSPDLEEGR
jgi:lipopolysaccharide export system protein LptA